VDILAILACIILVATNWNDLGITNDRMQVARIKYQVFTDREEDLSSLLVPLSTCRKEYVAMTIRSSYFLYLSLSLSLSLAIIARSVLLRAIA